MKTLLALALAVGLFAATGGIASAQYPLGQVPYSAPQAPVWSPPVTGYPAPYMPTPQSSYIPNPVYTAPVTGTVNPYPSRIR
jgi:hypothetical protein